MSALHVESGRRVAVNGGERFPMASTYKVPIAVHLLARIDRGELALDDMIEVKASDLHPGDGILTALLHRPGVVLSVANLLELMLRISDNSASDLVLRLAGGPGAVTAALRGLGIQDMDISRSTRDMIADRAGITALPPEDGWTPDVFRRLRGATTPESRRAAARRFDDDPRDSATPDAMVSLLARLCRSDLLQRESGELLLDTMRRSQGGEARLKGILPPAAALAHKTGTLLDGTTNDVGIITLPDGGGHIAVAVFIKGGADQAEAERTIAQIGRLVYEGFASPDRRSLAGKALMTLPLGLVLRIGRVCGRHPQAARRLYGLGRWAGERVRGMARRPAG